MKTEVRITTPVLLTALTKTKWTEEWKSVSPTFPVGGRSMDSWGYQRRSEEDVKPLVPVGGAGQYDHSLAQKLLFWCDGTVRRPCSGLSSLKTGFICICSCYLPAQIVLVCLAGFPSWQNVTPAHRDLHESHIPVRKEQEKKEKKIKQTLFQSQLNFSLWDPDKPLMKGKTGGNHLGGRNMVWSKKEKSEGE